MDNRYRALMIAPGARKHGVSVRCFSICWPDLYRMVRRQGRLEPLVGTPTQRHDRSVDTTVKYMHHRSRAGDARLLSAAFRPAKKKAVRRSARRKRPTTQSASATVSGA